MQNIVWTDSRILGVITAIETVAIELYNHQRDPGTKSRELDWYDAGILTRRHWRERARWCLTEAQASFEP